MTFFWGHYVVLVPGHMNRSKSHAEGRTVSIPPVGRGVLRPTQGLKTAGSCRKTLEQCHPKNMQRRLLMTLRGREGIGEIESSFFVHQIPTYLLKFRRTHQHPAPDSTCLAYPKRGRSTYKYPVIPAWCDPHNLLHLLTQTPNTRPSQGAGWRPLLDAIGASSEGASGGSNWACSAFRTSRATK